MLQLKLKRMPATKARQAPNRFKPGEMMTIKAKPARNVVQPAALEGPQGNREVTSLWRAAGVSRLMATRSAGSRRPLAKNSRYTPV